MRPVGFEKHTPMGTSFVASTMDAADSVAAARLLSIGKSMAICSADKSTTIATTVQGMCSAISLGGTSCRSRARKSRSRKFSVSIMLDTRQSCPGARCEIFSMSRYSSASSITKSSNCRRF